MAAHRRPTPPKPVLSLYEYGRAVLQWRQVLVWKASGRESGLGVRFPPLPPRYQAEGLIVSRWPRTPESCRCNSCLPDQDSSSSAPEAYAVTCLACNQENPVRFRTGAPRGGYRPRWATRLETGGADAAGVRVLYPPPVSQQHMMRSRGEAVPAGLITRRSWSSNPTSATTQVRCLRQHARLPTWRTGFDSLYLLQRQHATVVQWPRCDVANVEIRVRFSVVAPQDKQHGMWSSLEGRLLREQEAVGSNPTIPTDGPRRLGYRRALEWGERPARYGASFVSLFINAWPRGGNMVDAPVSDAGVQKGRAGSTPVGATKNRNRRTEEGGLSGSCPFG